MTTADAHGPATVTSGAAAGRVRRRVATALPLIVVVALAITLVVLRVQRDPATSSTVPRQTRTADEAVVAMATSVAPAVLNRVGTGGVLRVPTAINGATVVAGGRPRIVWSGAEYCPTCAAMRWPLVIALSRFGKFDGLAVTASSSREPYPNTPTFTFRDATYTSKFLSFTAYETASATFVDGHYAPLMTPPTADAQLLAAYDGPPYFADAAPSDPNAMPFVLFAGQYATTGSLYTPGVLDGLAAGQIARSLGDAESAVAQAVDGTANVLTAVLCSATRNTPREVCSSPAVKAARQVVSPRTS